MRKNPRVMHVMKLSSNTRTEKE